MIRTRSSAALVPASSELGQSGADGASSPRPRSAVCFFGITRSLSYTLPSIEKQILAPAARLGSVRTFAHFFRIGRIENPRSGEDFEVDVDEWRLLSPDELELEDPDACLDLWDFDRIKAYGDAFGDDFRSTANLVHQLHSLRKVTLMAVDWEPDLVLFCRPDLFYFDSFEKPVRRALSGRVEVAYLPYWQSFQGRNDRLAVIRGREVARIYGRRVERMLDFCHAGQRPLHSEPLLGWVLRGERVRPLAVRAARVRGNGEAAPQESFDRNWITSSHTWIYGSRLPKRMKDGLHKGLTLTQSGIDRVVYGRRADPWDSYIARPSVRSGGNGSVAQRRSGAPLCLARAMMCKER